MLAIKLNAADYVEGGMTEDQSLDHVRMIASWRIFDIIEISGGDYENLGMPKPFLALYCSLLIFSNLLLQMADPF